MCHPVVKYLVNIMNITTAVNSVPDGLFTRRLQHSREERRRPSQLQNLDLQHDLLQPSPEHLRHDVLLQRHLASFAVHEQTCLVEFDCRFNKCQFGKFGRKGDTGCFFSSRTQIWNVTSSCVVAQPFILSICLSGIGQAVKLRQPRSMM